MKLDVNITKIMKVEFVWDKDGFDFYFDKFREWCKKQHIAPQIGEGITPNGISGYYHMSDYYDIEGWLVDNGVEIYKTEGYNMS